MGILVVHGLAETPTHNLDVVHPPADAAVVREPPRHPATPYSGYFDLLPHAALRLCAAHLPTFPYSDIHHQSSAWLVLSINTDQ